MGNFNRGGSRGGKRFGDRGGFGGGKRFGGGRDRGGDRPTMHQAVCDECGNDCEVPFRPTGDKPIYCSNCFKDKGGSRDSGNRRDSRASFGEKPMFEATCDACGNECKVPFRPTSGKPVYCSDCFDDNKPSRSGGNDQLKEELALMQAKLDKILTALSGNSTKVKEDKPKAETKEKTVKKEDKPKVKKEAKKKK